MSIKPESEAVFQDVRKAYRFLYQYQRRVMDLIAYIANHWDYTFEKGEPIFCNPPSLKKVNPTSNHWAWDFLVFYNHNFVFQGKDFENYNDVKLMLNIVSDTGFFDNENNSKLNISDFGNVEKAGTKLHIILKTNRIKWDDYKEKQYPNNQNNSEYFLEPTKGKIVIGKRIDVAALMNEEDVLAELSKFEEYCSLKGIYLKPNTANDI